jgi:hypothetical protein
VLVSVLLVIITAAFGRAFYSADIPTGATLLRMLVMLVVGAAAFCALGFAISSVIPNADASQPIVNAVILPLLFLSGVFIPLGNNAPSWMLWVGRIFPIKHFLSGMQAGFLGSPFDWTDVLVVAAWGLAGPSSRSVSSAGNREQANLGLSCAQQSGRGHRDVMPWWIFVFVSSLSPAGGSPVRVAASEEAR